MVIIGDLESIEAATTLNRRRRPGATSSSVVRAMAAQALHTSNTGLPGAFKAPPPPPPTKTVNLRRRPAPAPATPITSQQLPAAPAPSPTPPPAAVVAMPGSSGGAGGGGGSDGGGGGIAFDATGTADNAVLAVQQMSMPTKVAVGVGAFVVAALIYKAVRR